MAETDVPVQETAAPAVAVEPTATLNPFATQSWQENDGAVEQRVVINPGEVKKEEVVAPASQAAKPEDEEEILEPNEWLKREFNWDSAEAAKAEVEELRKLKQSGAATKAEMKFADEQSKHIYELLREGGEKKKEVRKFLETQEKLDALTSTEVNKDTADDIIKLSMQLKYKDLTPQEIEYKFKKEFSIPKEPVFDESKESEDEFAQRKSEWQDRVNDIVINKVIEAKLARPELEKLKSQLVLPEITKVAAPQNEPTQESLAAQQEAIKAIRENFLQALESNYTKAEGFSTKVKDESVEIPVSFKIPDEDKVAIKTRLQEGFDVNDYIDKRWFDEKGQPKIEQMISDIFQLENPDKILSGIANNAANQRLKAYRKETSKIDVNDKTPQPTFSPQNGNAAISPFSQGAWSDKPPIYQN